MSTARPPCADHPFGEPLREPDGFELRGDERIADRERVGILDEDAGLARRSGAFPEHVPVEIALADSFAVGDEGVDAGARDLGIGHPVVEAFHQPALGDDGQVFDRGAVRGHVAIGLAVVRANGCARTRPAR